MLDSDKFEASQTVAAIGSIKAQRVLITGAAGFVGSMTSKQLLGMGYDVVGVDCFTDYYDISLKQARIKLLNQFDNFTFYTLDVIESSVLREVFVRGCFDVVIHFAGQAGVRYSIENPHAFVQGNLVGFGNVLELCREHDVKHLVFASSSSVYGNSRQEIFSEDDVTDAPVSLYAATKKSNELMAHSYSCLFNLPTTGLRFFNVYGPWGRPDMAYYKFTRAILNGTPIQVYNHGNLERDLTYVNDVVNGVIATALQPNSANNTVPFAVYNIGNNSPVKLNDFIAILEELLGVEAIKQYLPMQQGDVYRTCANTEKLQMAVGFAPSTPIKEGLRKFVEWYLGYHVSQTTTGRKALPVI